MACQEECKGIGEAVIGTSFVVGCQQCPVPPRFPPWARKSGGSKVYLYKKKFQKLGIAIN